MTVENKVQQLLKKFSVPAKKYRTMKPLFSEREQAKECALICVNEMIEFLEPWGEGCGMDDEKEFWNDVKSEIKKL